MPEGLEKVAVFTPEPPEKKEEKNKKKPKKIRIALFFDGTLNNRLNIEAREKDSEDYKDKGGFLGFFERDPDSNSYDNGRTNINIMQQAIGDEFKPSTVDYFASHYIEGQGTFNLKEDSTLGYAAGAGDSGVRSRAHNGVDNAYNSICAFKGFDKKKHFIEELTFDVFGFSRGAATARYAIHLLLSDALININMEQRLSRARIEVKEGAVKVGFAGLYDTVLSYLGSQRAKLSIDICEQKAHQNAVKVLHLASAEEHRKDFPISDISVSTKKGTGEEYFLPGVHSDVGGSYNMADETKIRAEKDPAKQKELMELTRNEEKVTIFEGDLYEVELDKANLMKQGWFKNADGKEDKRELSTIKKEAKKTIEDATKRRQTEVVLSVDGEFTVTLFFSPRRNSGPSGRSINRANHLAYRFRGASLTVTRLKIHTGYSNIPLKIMAEYAKEHALLSFTPKMLKRADTVINKVKLEDLEKKIMSYIDANPKGSSADDWLKEKSANNNLLTKYRHDHLNFSAKCKLGYAPDIVDGKRLRFLFNA